MAKCKDKYFMWSAILFISMGISIINSDISLTCYAKLWPACVYKEKRRRQKSWTRVIQKNTCTNGVLELNGETISI